MDEIQAEKSTNIANSTINVSPKMLDYKSLVHFEHF